MQNANKIIHFYDLGCYDIEYLESIREDVRNCSDYVDMLFLYKSHMDGLFVLDEYYSYGQLYCEQCGDYDTLITSGTKEEVLDLIDIAINISKTY